MKSYEIYRLYQCPRCKKMEWDVHSRPKDFAEKQYMGICKFSKLPVLQDFQYDLFPTPDGCDNWVKGKAKVIKEKK